MQAALCSKTASVSVDRLYLLFVSFVPGKSSQQRMQTNASQHVRAVCTGTPMLHSERSKGATCKDTSSTGLQDIVGTGLRR